MKKILAAVLMFGLATAYAADEKKAETKKSSKPKPAAKSDKNAAQKAEQGIYKWARENKIWTQSK